MRGLQGNFGYGWQLGLRDAQIVESAPDGRNVNHDQFFSGNSLTRVTRVTFTPDGRKVGFIYNPSEYIIF